MNKTRIYKTPFIVGLPVPPGQFFGRHEQVMQFYGQCIFGPVLQPTRILGLKRSGKTSFLKYVSNADVQAALLQETDFTSIKHIYINAQAIHSPNEFFETLAGMISEQLSISVGSPASKTGRAFQKWLEAVLRANTGLKLIILIDEFETLHECDSFDVDFFGLLRALANAYPSNFTWVTASSVDLYTLEKNQKTSPFWNIFHQMPIIMGSFEDQDARSLITESLATIQETITKREINEILALSGLLPYFVQAVADAWHNVRERQGGTPSKIHENVFDRLNNPDNQIQYIYRSYWDEMNENKRAILKSIASEKRNFIAAYSDLMVLLDFGLIVRDNSSYGSYRISGQLLKQFIIEVGDDETPPPGNNRKANSDSDSHPIVVVKKDTHIHTDGGTYIHGDLNNEGNITQETISDSQITVNDIKDIFEGIYSGIDARTDLAKDEKADLIAEIDELRAELAKKEKADEGFLLRRLRNIGRMAPDILQVTLATIANPVAGFGVIAQKVAEKAKAKD